MIIIHKGKTWYETHDGINRRKEGESLFTYRYSDIHEVVIVSRSTRKHHDTIRHGG